MITDLEIPVYIFTTAPNQPPDQPFIEGDSEIEVGETEVYTIHNITDPDDDQLYTWVDWGDGTHSGWNGPYPSGTPRVQKSHTWYEEGKFKIKVKTKDIYGDESEWSELKQLSAPEPESEPNPQPCFLAGTQISMADGTFKNIEDIDVGDMVLSCDRFHNRATGSQVTKVYHHSPDEMSDYYLIINDDLQVTPNHLLFINNIWKHADNAVVGDFLLGTDGQPVPIETIEQVYMQVPTYNFEIGTTGTFETHTYVAQGTLATTKKDIVTVIVQDIVLQSHQSYRELLTV